VSSLHWYPGEPGYHRRRKAWTKSRWKRRKWCTRSMRQEEDVLSCPGRGPASQEGHRSEKGGEIAGGNGGEVAGQEVFWRFRWRWGWRLQQNRGGRERL